MFSGGFGRMTPDTFTQSEAATFAAIAIQNGVPRSNIILETTPTNTGENIRFSYRKLVQLDLLPSSAILVQKLYVERRTYTTFKK